MSVVVPSLPASTADLVAHYDRPGPRYTSYPPVPNWTKPFGEAEYLAALDDAARDSGDLALYVHLPFCPVRCLYCGCNVSVTRNGGKIDAYLDRLECEMDRVVDRLGRRRKVTQVHWGGGTPNVLSEEQLLRLHELLVRRFDIGADAEQSVEADPRLVSHRQLQWLYALGFRRISFGVQDLDPDVQQAIGRVQPAELVTDAILAAREVGFRGVNVDLIYGLPRQSVETFDSTIRQVLRWRPERAAVFGYAHVPWMKKHQRAIPERELPSSAERFELFHLAVERFREAGYAWLGLDHFAVPEDPLAKAFAEGRLHRNFMGYTTMPAQHLLAFGASAIGEVAGRYVQLSAELPEYAEGIDAGHLPVVRGHVLTDDDARRKRLIMDLMCNLRLSWEEIGDERGTITERLAAYVRDGLVILDEVGLRVTDAGRYLLRNVAMEFDAYLRRASGDGPRYSRTV